MLIQERHPIFFGNSVDVQGLPMCSILTFCHVIAISNSGRLQPETTAGYEPGARRSRGRLWPGGDECENMKGVPSLFACTQ